MKWRSVWNLSFAVSWVSIRSNIINYFLLFIDSWFIVIFLMSLVPRLFNVMVSIVSFCYDSVIAHTTGWPITTNESSLVSNLGFQWVVIPWCVDCRLLLTSDATAVFSSPDSFRQCFDSEYNSIKTIPCSIYSLTHQFTWSLNSNRVIEVTISQRLLRAVIRVVRL